MSTAFNGKAASTGVGRMRLAIACVAAVASLGVGAPAAWAIPYSQSKLIIEVNSTGEDAGIQLFADAPGWTSLELFAPNGEKLTDIRATGGVGLQGLTELFAESAEPSFEDQSLAELFERFPEGIYRLEGVTVDGKSLSGQAAFRHNIPNAPHIVSPEEGEEVDADEPVVVDWDPVTTPFPGTTLGVTVVGYQVIVERVKPQPHLTFSVFLPASVTQLTVSPEFMQDGADYVIEVLAIDASGNQTITEREFQTEGSRGRGEERGRGQAKRASASRLDVRATPNPATDLTSIRFSTPSPSRVRLAVYDVQGRLVRRLVDGERAPGRHDVVWDRRDSGGRPVSRGIYFAEVRAGGARERTKVIVAR